MTLHPQKWRETCDPFRLGYRHFRPTEILGYPHARNDVFHVRGEYKGKTICAYVKAARHDAAALLRDVQILSQLNAPVFPRLLDAGETPAAFSVTEELPGARLSVILGENAGNESLRYMAEYGAALAQIHSMQPSAPAQADRQYRHRPPPELLHRLSLPQLEAFFSSPPSAGKTVFCHGDFHYANILWQNGHISGILDFELSGYGDRDFDIAWAMFLRPGQRFLQTPQEQQLFLEGYGQHGEYDPCAVHYYMAQNYVYFLQFSDDAPEYAQYIRTWLAENCK